MINVESKAAAVINLSTKVTPTGHAGYCRTHYVEYLCGLVIRWRHTMINISINIRLFS